MTAAEREPPLSPIRAAPSRSPFVRLRELLGDAPPGKRAISLAVGEPQHPVERITRDSSPWIVAQKGWHGLSLAEAEDVIPSHGLPTKSHFGRVGKLAKRARQRRTLRMGDAWNNQAARANQS